MLRCTILWGKPRGEGVLQFSGFEIPVSSIQLFCKGDPMCIFKVNFKKLSDDFSLIVIAYSSGLYQGVGNTESICCKQYITPRKRFEQQAILYRRSSLQTCLSTSLLLWILSFTSTWYYSKSKTIFERVSAVVRTQSEKKSLPAADIPWHVIEIVLAGY